MATPRFRNIVLVGSFAVAISQLATSCGGRALKQLSDGTGGTRSGEDDDGNAGRNHSDGARAGNGAGAKPSGDPGVPIGGTGTGGSTVYDGFCYGPICADPARENGCATTIQDFESTTEITEAAAWGADPGIDLASGLAGGTYAYGDGGDAVVVLETADGADATSKYFHYSQQGAVQWGGGFGFWFYCTDVSIYDGVSFWLKGTLPAPGPEALGPGIEIAFQNPETSLSDCTCEGFCRAPRVYQDITEDWALYAYEWSDIGPGNTGSMTPDHEFNPEFFHGINFHIPAAVGEDIDVSVDELAFLGGNPSDTSCDAGGSSAGGAPSSAGAGGTN
jgi:hypothetical protein